MIDVACIGVLVADTIVKTVDKIPEKGKLALYDSVRLYSGGCAANAAIDLAKLGANASIIGMVGNDGFGSFMKSELEKYKVKTEGLYMDDESDTSASVVLIDQSGERSFIHSIGANGVFSEKHVNYEIIEQSKIVFVAGCMLMPKFDGTDCATLLKKSKEMGKVTVLDTAWDDKGNWMKTLAPCMPYIDYFLPSIEEAEQLSGKSTPEEIADVFFDMGVGSVVIKLGKRGCYAQESKNSKGVYIATYDNVKAVDTTGAGDSFCSGFIYGLLIEKSIEDCCRIANAVGTHCVMEVGASTGIKPYAEIKKFMKENQI